MRFAATPSVALAPDAFNSCIVSNNLYYRETQIAKRSVLEFESRTIPEAQRSGMSDTFQKKVH